MQIAPVEPVPLSDETFHSISSLSGIFHTQFHPSYNLSDLIGALLFPIGAYHPGFTLTATLTGLVYGLCFQKGYRLSRACLAVAYSQVVGTLLLNTLWVYTIAKSSYLVLLTARLPEFFLMGTVKLLTITLLLPRLDRWLLPLTQGRGKELRS